MENKYESKHHSEFTNFILGIITLFIFFVILFYSTEILTLLWGIFATIVLLPGIPMGIFVIAWPLIWLYLKLFTDSDYNSFGWLIAGIIITASLMATQDAAKGIFH